MSCGCAELRQLYDVRRDVTALQLRQLGFYLSEMIPDSAFVRRIAVGFQPDEILQDGTASLGLQVLDRFQPVG